MGMTFDEVKSAITAIAPGSLSLDYVNSDYQEMEFAYTDSDGDGMKFRLTLDASKGKKIVVEPVHNNMVYFSPEVCHWLGMVASIVEEM